MTTTATSISNLYTVDIAKIVGVEYVGMFEDIIRMICIQFTIQVMLYLEDSSRAGVFTGEFMALLCYIVLGVLLYWLVFRSILGFQHIVPSPPKLTSSSSSSQQESGE